jgi:hypothetical protein
MKRGDARDSAADEGWTSGVARRGACFIQPETQVRDVIEEIERVVFLQAVVKVLNMV